MGKPTEPEQNDDQRELYDFYFDDSQVEEHEEIPPEEAAEELSRLPEQSE